MSSTTSAKVIMSNSNRLTNLLFNRLNNKTGRYEFFNEETLEKVLLKSFGKKISSYEVELSDSFNRNGQFIVVEYGDCKKYIVFSFEMASATRNGYLLAKTPVSYREFIDDKHQNKYYEICLLDLDSKIYNEHKNSGRCYKTKDLNIDNLSSSGCINDYNVFTYRLLKTIGARIINEDALPFNEYINRSSGDSKKEYINKKFKIGQPFMETSEIRKERLKLSEKNTGNRGSYILENSDKTFVYGKTFGNNGFEVVMIALACATINNKNNVQTIMYQIKDTLGVEGFENKEAKPITEGNIKLLKNSRVIVIDELQDYEDNPESDTEYLFDRNIRNQALFMKNLMKKYGLPGHEDEKMCYICGNTIQDTIIASHIQRVCDINQMNISWEEKRKKATDGDNGMWLCATHDKLFEYGLISFDEEDGDMVFDSNRLTTQQLEYIGQITDEKPIKKIHFNSNVKEYLSFHNNRLRNDYPNIVF